MLMDRVKFFAEDNAVSGISLLFLRDANLGFSCIPVNFSDADSYLIVFAVRKSNGWSNLGLNVVLFVLKSIKSLPVCGVLNYAFHFESRMLLILGPIFDENSTFEGCGKRYIFVLLFGRFVWVLRVTAKQVYPFGNVGNLTFLVLWAISFEDIFDGEIHRAYKFIWSGFVIIIYFEFQLVIGRWQL